MKKILTIISALLVIIFAASAAVPALALDDDKYIEKEVTAYMYSMDKTETFTCLFNSDLPDVPFMDVIDFLSKTYILERTLIDNGDGTYTVSCLTGDIDFDVVNDTVYFSCYEISVIYGPYSEGSSLAADYIKGSKTSSIGDTEPMTFDLGKYGFDIVEHNGRVYLPIPVLCDIFCPSYNAAEYIDGCLYFLHTMESSIGDGYFDRSPIYNKLERTPETAEYTYNELCF